MDIRIKTSDIDMVFRELSLISKPMQITVKGIVLTVFPQVFSPKYSHSPDYLIDNFDFSSDSTVLDLGSGSGILSIFALLKGVKKLVALDINPQAVANTAYNIKKFGFKNIAEARESNVFSGLKFNEKFDVILFNPPFFDRRASSDLEKACFDEGHVF